MEDFVPYLQFFAFCNFPVSTSLRFVNVAVALGSLTLPYGLLSVELQRSHDEAGLAQRAPVVQHPQRPQAGPQRRGERRPVVGDLGGGVHKDVVGGGNDVGGVDPHHSGRQVALAAAPALHGHRLVLGPHEAPPVPEETLLGIPVCPDLKNRRRVRVGLTIKSRPCSGLKLPCGHSLWIRLEGSGNSCFKKISNSGFQLF